MRKKQVEEKVRNAFTQAVPNVLDAVLSDCQSQERNGVIMTMEMKKKKNTVGRWIAAAAAVVIVLGAVSFGLYRFDLAPMALVSLDVNPGIEIEVNRNEKVLSVVPLNKDAQVVVGDMDFKGSELDVTVNALIGSMLRNGYLTDMANSILVSVDNDDPAKGKELQTRLMSMIEEMLKTDSFTGSVLGQTVTADDQVKALQETYGITEGKAELIRRITEKNTLYKAEDLANLSINELNFLVQRKDTAPESVTTVGAASQKAYIGQAKAKEIALNHAKIAEKDITDYEWEMDFDDGAMIYEVDFDAKGYDFNYDIDALTGKIVDYETDRDDDAPVANDKNNTPVVNGNNDDNDDRDDQAGQNSSSSLIGKTKAKEIALNHAGVSAGNIRDYSIELDEDDGVISYEIEFDAGGYEYKYDIHAGTGNVLSVDKERLDDDDYDDYDNDRPVSSNNTAVTTTISREKAKEIVLAHAGVSAGDIRDYSIELDEDDGVTHYEIEFNAGNVEYSYEISQKTGSILKADKEIDD